MLISKAKILVDQDMTHLCGYSQILPLMKWFYLQKKVTGKCLMFDPRMLVDHNFVSCCFDSEQFQCYIFLQILCYMQATCFPRESTLQKMQLMHV